MSLYWLAWPHRSDESVNRAGQGPEDNIWILDPHLRDVEAIVPVKNTTVSGGPARRAPGRQ